MSNLKLRKSQPVRLRDAGLNESWLQEQIVKDPSLLGLGDLHLIQREKSQPSGGRLDFLMYDPEAETRYEIEVMLGATNESHIIRTIEYWDVERQRYPTLDHRAVIVAEEITARFFNVIRLLNRAVPLMAIQLSAFQIDDSIVLQFTRVLDTYEFGADPEEEESGEQTDRAYWERHATKESLQVMDALVSLAKSRWNDTRIVYKKGHVTLGTSAYNFCWLHPRKVASHCHVDVRVDPEKRPAILETLESAGIDSDGKGRTIVRLRLSMKNVTEKGAAIEDLLRAAEEWSHR